MLALILLTTTPPDYREPPTYREPPAAVVKAQPVEEVVVSVDAAGWHAAYKGRATTFPRATPAADVQRLAGDWGREIDTPPPPPPTAFTPFRFTSGGT
jgi:hypothetical protein